MDKIRKIWANITNGIFRGAGLITLFLFCFDLVFNFGWIQSIDIKELVVYCTLIIVAVSSKF